jgi:hypothetical protein
MDGFELKARDPAGPESQGSEEVGGGFVIRVLPGGRAISCCRNAQALGGRWIAGFSLAGKKEDAA